MRQQCQWPLRLRSFSCPVPEPSAAHPRLMPQRHAHTDLMRALSGQVGNHAVDSDGGEHERKSREHAKEKHRQLLCGDGTRNNLFHRPDIKENRAGIHLFCSLANGSRETNRRSHSPGNILAAIREKRPELVRNLPNGKIELYFEAFVFARPEAPMLDVPNHAYDFRLHIEQSEVDSFSDGIFVWKKFMR